MNIESFSVCILDNDLWMQLTPSVHNSTANVAAWVFFQLQRFTFDDIHENNFTAGGCKDWNLVWIPFAELLSLWNLLVFFDGQSSTRGNVVAFEFATASVDNGDFAVAS